MKTALKKAISLALAVTIMVIGFSSALSVSAFDDGGLSYSLASDGNSYILIGCDKAVSGEVVIPDSVSGKPVSLIDDGAFRECNSLTGVVVPDSVKEISVGAFTDCPALSTLTFGAGLETFYGDVFYHCESISQINISPSNEFLTASDGIIYNKDKTNIFACATAKSGVVTIPSTVKGIFYAAFLDCNDITAVNMSDSVIYMGLSAFSGCSSLTEFRFPKNLNEIPYYVLSDCTSLKSVTLPEKAVAIYSGAFENCTELDTFIGVSDKITMVYSSAFTGTKWRNNAPDGVLYFGAVACEYVGEIPADGHVEIRNGTKILNYQLFENRGALKSITLPGTLELIDDYAFSGSGLKSVTIPASTYIIGSCAFCDCTDLETVVMNEGTEAIFSSAFEGCTSLANITIPDSVIFMQEQVFDNTAWAAAQPDGMVYAGRFLYKYKGTLPAGSNVVIPDGTVGICDRAFLDQTGLASVSIPQGVMSINNYAFCGCTSLTSVVLPEGIEDIDMGVFRNCTSLTSVTIPASVTEISKEAFMGCTALTSITIPGTVEYVYSKAFQGCTSLREAVIEKGVLHINGSFGDCPQLESVTLPYTLSYIDITNEFKNCPNVKIKGYDNTLAQIIAEARAIPFVSLGAVPDIYSGFFNVFEGIIFCNFIDCPLSALLSVLINSPDTIKVFDRNGAEITDMSLTAKTGMTIKLYINNSLSDEVTVTVRGDVDGDGVISAADARMALRAATKLDVLPEASAIAASVNSNGEIPTAADARAILRVATKLESFETYKEYIYLMESYSAVIV